jgi:hypothetical protein
MKLLRGPISLQLTTGWDKKLDSAGKPAEGGWTTIKDGRIEGIRRLSWPEIEVENQMWMEYDGLLWSTVRVLPDRELTVTRMTLEIPVADAFSKLINPSDYSLVDTGKVPEEGWHESFRPVWVGNAYGGIQWMAQSDVSWNVTDRRKEVSVVPGEDGATLRVTFIDKPTVLTEPLEVSFGLIATPARDRYPQYRRWLSADAPIAWGYTWFPKGSEMAPAPDKWATNYGPFIRHRPENPKPNSRWVDGKWRFAEKAYSGPYVSHGRTRTDLETFKDFGDEWRANVNDTSVGTTTVTQTAASYRDFFVWRFARLMEQKPFAALYYDVSRPVSTNNVLGGGGARKDGRLMMTESLLGCRNIVKRLYHMVKSRYPDGIIKYHMSGQPNMGFLAFCDAMVDGENTASLLRSNEQDPRTYRGLMTPAIYRAEYMGHNFGAVSDWLPQFTRHGGWDYESLATPEGVAACDQILGLTLLHDASLWKAYMTPLSYERMRKALRRHNWGSKYKMIPYWEQDIVDCPDNMMASLYVEPEGTVQTEPIDTAGYYYRSLGTTAKKVILIVYNESYEKGKLSLDVDWGKLGFESTEGLKVENAVHSTGLVETTDGETGETKWELGPDPEETATIEDGELVFPMTPYNYRMIVIWRE